MRAAWLALALLAPVAQAQTVWGVHLVSLHSHEGREWLTPGAYVRTEAGATFGAYRNSHAALSVYAGWTWQRGPWALTVGGVTGYERARVLPMLAPSYRFDSGVRLSVIPNPWGATVLHLSWER